MLARQARQVARVWVEAHARDHPGFAGAFFTGSANELAGDDVLPATSDLDLMIVLDGPEPPEKPGKLVEQGVLLEVSYVARAEVASPDAVLGHYHLAHSFRRPNVVADPTGELTALQDAVSRDFARRDWVRRRCEHAANNVKRHLRGLRPADALHDQVLAWVFATGVTTHLPLVAALQNPTVRRRYLAAREVLAAYGCLDFYEQLLALLGCQRMTCPSAERHLAAVADAFDDASAAVRTSFFFASDLSRRARPITIDGSRALIERGDHREAIFWLVVTYARCLAVLRRDGPPELAARHEAGLWDLLNELGIDAVPDLQRRGDAVERFLPELWDVTEAIVAANPAIRD